MKTLLLIFTLLVSSVFLSSPSYSEWTKVGTDSNGNTFYLDYDRIRKYDGFVYYWMLQDYLKPNKMVLSSKVYKQSDCKLFRFKFLTVSIHKKPMGGGNGDTLPLFETHKDWKYPPPTSPYETILKSVCSH